VCDDHYTDEEEAAMAWLRLDDGLDNDPIILNIARSRADAMRILGSLTGMMLYAARHLTDGFLPELIVREHLRSKRLREAFTHPPGGGTPLLHRRGDTCECLDGRLWPATGADYAIHHYLQSNPTRGEYDVQRAKQAELRDRELLAAVRRRDGDCCRYCGTKTRWADRRSGAGMVLDHIDPATAAGAMNLVIACRSCNSRKGNRTPEAAAMTVLPPLGQTSDETNAPTNGSTNGKTNWSTTGPTTHAPVRDGTGRVNAAAGDAGPDGIRTTIGPIPPRPDSAHPNPYHRTAITGPDPADHPGLPD
jgi:5-methylcytosine-specific restriction endonuclease McrA